MTDEKSYMFNLDRIIPDFMQSVILFFSIVAVYTFLACEIPVIYIDFFYTVIPLILVAILTFVRNMNLSKIPMICAHLLVTIAYVVISITLGLNSAPLIIYTVFASVALMVFSIRQRISVKDANKTKRFKETFLILIAVQGIALLFLYMAKQEVKVSQMLWCILISISMFTISRQLTVFEDKYTHTAASSSQRASEVEKQNTKTVLILSVVLIIALICLVVFPFETVASIVVLFFRKIFHFLLSRLFTQKEIPDLDKIEKQEEPDWGDQAGDIPKYLNVMFFVVIGIILLLGLLYVIKLVMSSFSRFEKSEKKVIGDGIVTDIIEKVQKKKAEGNRHLDFGSGYEYKIRKRYYSKVSKAIKHGLPIDNASSPNEIKGVLIDSGDEEINELTREYEKVRYGQNSN